MAITMTTISTKATILLWKASSREVTDTRGASSRYHPVETIIPTYRVTPSGSVACTAQTYLTNLIHNVQQYNKSISFKSLNIVPCVDYWEQQ